MARVESSLILTTRLVWRLFAAGRLERRIEEQREAHRALLVERRASRMLTLGGWNSYRSRLVDTEHESLGFKDIALSEAQSRVVVQEGEGYRPLSPSQHLSRQRSELEVE